MSSTTHMILDPDTETNATPAGLDGLLQRLAAHLSKRTAHITRRRTSDASGMHRSNPSPRAHLTPITR